MSNISVGVRLSPKLHERLVDCADQEQTTKSEIIKAALSQYLGLDQELPVPQRLQDLERKVQHLEQICHDHIKGT